MGTALGCGFTDHDWQTQMEAAEQEMFAAVQGLDMDKLMSRYVVNTVNGVDYAVRVHVYNDVRKPTLLMTHGYAMASVFHARMLPALAQHYRIVLFDNLSWGLNARSNNVGDALESPEKAENWIVTWWHNLITSLIETNSLPSKFYLSAHSAGGYQAMLYASYHPEHIDALFLQSPACAEDTTRDGWVYDPYTIRLGDHDDSYPTREHVD